MKIKKLSLGLVLFSLMLSCNTTPSNGPEAATYPNVKMAGAMRDVMWKGELAGKIQLDTLAEKKHLYGLGPQSYLTGELLIKDGVSYLSQVANDSLMRVQKTFAVSAPFFVYGYVAAWEEVALPVSVKSITDLEKFIDEKTLGRKRPFAFKLEGSVSKAVIHIQNLPKGSTVSSPEEAHQGQVKYKITPQNASIVGFFSKEHQGVFTHHDSFVHMHLVTSDELKMGHLDDLEIDSMQLFLPMK